MRGGLRLLVVTLMLSLTLGATVTGFVYRQERTVRDEVLSGTLREFSHRTQERINQFVALLTATSAYVGTRPSEPITRARFVNYVDALGDLDALAGVQGIGIALLAPRSAAPELDARIKRDYGPEARIWRNPLTPQEERELSALGGKELMSAIVLLAPGDTRNLRAIGYDMYSEPLRREAMERARDSRRPALSAPVTLVQETSADQQVGALIYIYTDGSRGVEREGFVYSPMRMGHLFDVLTVGLPDIYLEVIDVAMPEPPLFVSPGLAQRGAKGLIRSSMQLEIGGRTWRMTSFTPPPLGGWLTRTPVAFLTAIASLLLSLLAAVAVHGLSAAERHTRQLSEVQARRLADQELHLREMSHRLKNVLARVVAMARQAARHADSTEEFVTALNQRLQAMAVAQDLLTRSASDGAELRDLIGAEIAQIYGMGQDFAAISGPRVILTPQQTQALGLSMHELATNSLKYGAGAMVGAELRISWVIDSGEGGERVDLLWEEITGLPGKAPERRGSGSRLLENCIRLELGGEIIYDYHDMGLRVRITFPLVS